MAVVLVTADTGGTKSEPINDSITLNNFILINDSAIPLTPPICNYLAPDSNTTLIADTGCSGHYDAYTLDKNKCASGNTCERAVTQRITHVQHPHPAS